jgi:tRNA threonylcarbamoyladenosine biosynthesis protein TsaE
VSNGLTSTDVVEIRPGNAAVVDDLSLRCGGVPFSRKQMHRRVIQTDSPQQTELLAAKVARVAVPGLVIALDGELGSGKTWFVRAFSIVMGVEPSLVNSPTFVLLQYYPANQCLIAHMDAFRLADPDEFLAIGGDEVLSSDDNICLIEWSERVSDLLPRDHLAVQITQVSHQSRRFEFSAACGIGATVLQGITESRSDGFEF